MHSHGQCALAVSGHAPGTLLPASRPTGALAHTHLLPPLPVPSRPSPSAGCAVLAQPCVLSGLWNWRRLRPRSPVRQRGFGTCVSGRQTPAGWGDIYIFI